MNGCFLITVGTSLIEKYLNPNGRQRQNVSFVFDNLKNKTCDESFWEDNLNVDTLHTNIIKNTEPKLTSVIDSYKNAYNEINPWSITNNIDKLKDISAELKTLLKLKQKLGANFSSNDKIYLFPTFTYDGALCAKILKDILARITNGALIEVIFTKGLNSAKDVGPTFTSEGIPKLLNNIYRKIEGGKEVGKEIYLLISGGYKSIVPYTTLIGLLTRHGLYYIYEDSDQLLELPNLPISIDMNVFRPNFNFIKNIQVTNNRSYLDSLSPDLQSLFEVDCSGNIKPTPVLDFLIQRYTDTISKSSLTLQAGNMTVLTYLKKENREDLLNKFIKLNEIGPFLWIGDKVPEMVDHALKHHDNLFTITDIIIAPILNGQFSNCNGKLFLSPEELFILLCTIYLHDFGHVLSSFPSSPDRKLLASEIREYHHVLGYERLTKHNETLTLLSGLLNWVDKNGKTKDEIEKEYLENYFNAIATIGLYHRKVMPLKADYFEKHRQYFKLNGNNIPEECAFTISNKNFRFAPLEKCKVSFMRKEIGPERLLFLVSLFRVIDSLDNQFARIGETNEFLFRMISLIIDVKEENRRAEEIGEFLNCHKEEIDKLFKTIEDSCEKIPSLCVEESIDKLCKKIKLDKKLVFIYLDTKSRAFIKQNQFKHYLKHLFLDVPYFNYEFNNGMHIIKVTIGKSKDFDKNVKALEEKLNVIFPEEKDEVREELEKAINKYTTELDCKMIFEDIVSDYEIVKETLNESCLKFEFENKLSDNINNNENAT